MMVGLAPVSLTTLSIAASTDFKGSAKRRYLSVYSDVPCNITIDGATFVLAAGVPFAPIPAITNAITVEPIGGTATVMEG